MDNVFTFKEQNELVIMMEMLLKNTDDLIIHYQSRRVEMITYVRTNIFESHADVLVNTVNTVGVMGKGLAKEFKRIYPDMFESYQKFCEDGTLVVGKLQVYKTPNKWVLNFPTKANWRSPSKLEYIEQGLQKFVEHYARLGIKSIAFPMLGCGNGGLSWEKEVKPLMLKYLEPLPIDIFIHVAWTV